MSYKVDKTVWIRDLPADFAAVALRSVPVGR